MSSWPSKDPDDVLDYQIDWTARLADDNISSSEWIVPDGIDMTQETFDTKTATIWLDGGSQNETYAITNRITTEGGRVIDKTGYLLVREA